MTARLRHVLRFSLSIFCVLTATYSLTSYSNETATVSSGAIGYYCKLGDSIRRVEIHYPRAPKTLPCEVIYHRDTESPEILWRAENDASYCEKQADAMVDRLIADWGWQCTTL